MKLLSVNTGTAREIMLDGVSVLTGIYKFPVQGPRMMRKLRLEGDEQGDAVLHGGPDKSVCVYPSEHYADWSAEWGGADLRWGVFGENLTTEGLRESAVHLGDRFRIGSAEVAVTQPRMPCPKLNYKFGRGELMQRVLQTGRTGFYLSVIQEGEVSAGDRIEWVHQDPRKVSVAEAAQLNGGDRPDPELLRRALEIEILPQRLRDRFLRKLEAIRP